MICPLGNQDKQALLEAEDTSLRAETLATLLEMENSFQSLNTEGQDDVRHNTPAKIQGGGSAQRLDPALLNLLVCPVTRGPLTLDQKTCA